MAWGANNVGQLGDGTSTGPETCHEPSPGQEYTFACSRTPIAVSDVGEATAIAVGSNLFGGPNGWSLAVLKDGSVMAWGADERGQLGDGGTAAATACACSTTDRGERHRRSHGRLSRRQLQPHPAEQRFHDGMGKQSLRAARRRHTSLARARRAHNDRKRHPGCRQRPKPNHRDRRRGIQRSDWSTDQRQPLRDHKRTLGAFAFGILLGTRYRTAYLSACQHGQAEGAHADGEACHSAEAVRTLQATQVQDQANDV